MSVILVKNGNEYNSSLHHQYQILSENEVAELPGTNICAVGSEAILVLDNMIIHAWILCEDDVWRQVK